MVPSYMKIKPVEPEFDFGKPYHGTRKRSKFDYGEDLVVVPVEIEIQSELYNLI
jgi:hypothetical protein